MLQKVHAVCATGDALVRIRTFLGDHAIDLPYGVDCRVFKPGPASVRSALGWTDQHRVIGYAGRLTHLKGVDLLAAAFRDLSRSVSNARLLIVGSGEEEGNIRRALAKEMARGVAHIEPGMSQEQLANWYRSMDVLAMPSRYEAFSLALLEAMACGIPFLASDVGGNKILAETGAGWLFEPESVSSLITCLGKILNNSPELKARGNIGLDYVQEHHSWAATAERLEKIIISRLGAEK
jgi:glycosyltransferase involved in cell wall biosynthesis